MTKKAFLLFVAAIAAILLPLSLSAATDMSGRWSVYPTIGYDVTKVTEGNGRMYAVSNGKLYSRDAETDEVYIYSTSNKLSDIGIKDIFYNKDSKYLLVCYDNGNIDMLFDDGRVANLPEIKDAVISSGHGINDVYFADGRIYIATEFGLAVYDEKKQEIVDSGIYNISADHLLPMGDYLLLITGDYAYSSPKNMRHHSFDSFTKIVGLWSSAMQPLSDNTIIYNHPNGLHKVVFDFSDNTFTRNTYNIKISDDIIQRLEDGSVFAYNADKAYIISDAGIRETIDIPEALKNTKKFSAKGLSSVWAADIDGVAQYDISGTTPTVLMQPFRPEALTVHEAWGATWSNDGERLYIVRRTPSQFFDDVDTDNSDGIQSVNIFYPATGQIKDVTVPRFDPSALLPSMSDVQKRTGWPGIVGGPSRVVEDPDKPETWYQAFNYAPFFAFQGNEVLGSFNNTNCYNGTNRPRGYSVSIDPAGNLWLGIGHKQAYDATFLVLPADKRRGDIAKISKSDFIPVDIPDFSGTRELSPLFCKRSNYIFVTVGAWTNSIAVIDTKGTPSDFSDDTYMVHNMFYDTEGHSLDVKRLPFPVEDHNGQVWFCSDIGPLVLTRPATAMTSELAFRRPIVPRNDGTQFGDYLLDGVKVLSIAVDPSNRKWITTNNDGVYLVSEDGTEILRHFTSSNSPLNSNTVYFAACHPLSNKVFFGTADGLYSFDSDSSPAAEDYSDVYAYPNPVRPDYTGWITIAGLKDNSLVKIADIAGNVFFQGRSEGGMISWDGCNSAGERVRTGVYFVFASENNDGGSSGAVAKIMVVN